MAVLSRCWASATAAGSSVAARGPRRGTAVERLAVRRRTERKLVDIVKSTSSSIDQRSGLNLKKSKEGLDEKNVRLAKRNESRAGADETRGEKDKDC